MACLLSFVDSKLLYPQKDSFADLLREILFGKSTTPTEKHHPSCSSTAQTCGTSISSSLFRLLLTSLTTE